MLQILPENEKVPIGKQVANQCPQNGAEFVTFVTIKNEKK